MAIKLPKLPFTIPPILLGPRARKIARYAGFVVFAIVVFVFAVQLSFPYSRVKDKVIEALQDKYDVTIRDVERGIMPGRVYFNDVSIRTHQTKPEEVVTFFNIKQLEVDLGVLALLGGTISVDFDAYIGDAKNGFGHLSGDISIGSMGKGEIEASIEGDSLPSAGLPIRAALGLPMTGKMEFDLDLRLPVDKSKTGRTSINWQKASGSFSLSCPTGCTFGDGKTKLKPLLKNTRQQVMVGEGIDFGKVTMQSLAAKVTMKRGKLTVDKFETVSQDGELKVDYTMTLDKEFSESMVAGCLRFKASDDLLRREPRTHAAISTTGAERRADGFFHIRLTDRFKDMKRLNMECGPGTNINNAENFNRASDRPNLTIQPDPTGSAIAAPPPPPLLIPDAQPATPPHDAGSSATVGPAPPTAVPSEGAPVRVPGSAVEPPPGWHGGPGSAGSGSAGSGSGGPPAPGP